MADGINGFISNLRNVFMKAAIDKLDELDGKKDGKIDAEALFKLVSEQGVDYDEEQIANEFLDAMEALGVSSSEDVPVSANKEIPQEILNQNAFAYNGSNTMADSSNLQYAGVIDKPMSYTFGIPEGGMANQTVTGKGEYGTGRVDDYTATYDEKGRVKSILSTNPQFGETSVAYTYDDKGGMVETQINKHSGSKMVTEYNPDGTVKSSKEYLADDYGDDMDFKDLEFDDEHPVISKDYTYSVDENGNPQQTMKNNHGVEVVTTLKPDEEMYVQENKYTGTSSTYKASIEKEKTDDLPFDPPMDGPGGLVQDPRGNERPPMGPQPFGPNPMGPGRQQMGPQPFGPNPMGPGGQQMGPQPFGPQPMGPNGPQIGPQPGFGPQPMRPQPMGPQPGFRPQPMEPDEPQMRIQPFNPQPMEPDEPQMRIQPFGPRPMEPGGRHPHMRPDEGVIYASSENDGTASASASAAFSVFGEGQMSFSAEANAQAGAQTFFGRDADGKMVSVTYDPQTQTYTADGKECNYDRVTGVVNYNE